MKRRHPKDLLLALPMELLTRRADLKEEILDAVARFKLSIGWHYLLDLIWLLEATESLPAGSLILDAGAGNGLLQILLASRGHKVLSVDFAPRTPLAAYHDVAAIRVLDGPSFSNEYLQHLAATYRMEERPQTRDAVRVRPLAVLSEHAVDIVYWRADLQAMTDLPDHSIDAVVSVSALEHNSPEGLVDCVRELMRVLKPGAALHATTSGSDREDWFHAPSKGWCYSEKSLVAYFGLTAPQSNFDRVGELFAALKQGDGLKEHLANVYFTSGENGMPWGNWAPLYFPVGVRRTA